MYVYIYIHMYMCVNQFYILIYQVPKFPGNVPLEPILHTILNSPRITLLLRSKGRHVGATGAGSLCKSAPRACRMTMTHGTCDFISKLGNFQNVSSKQEQMDLYSAMIWVMNQFNGLKKEET